MTQETLRALSKQLYGTSYRLEVSAAIASVQPHVITAADLAVTLDVPAENYTVVRAELEKLTVAGLLVRLPRVKGQRLQYYAPVQTEYWDGASRMLNELQKRVADDRSEAKRSGS